MRHDQCHSLHQTLLQIEDHGQPVHMMCFCRAGVHVTLNTRDLAGNIC